MFLMFPLVMFNSCSNIDDNGNSSDGNIEGEGVSKTTLCNTWVLVSRLFNSEQRNINSLFS